MRSNPILAGVACGAAIGLGALVVIDAATDTADAQSGFTVSAGQLRINQKISQAAVRRGHEALNLLRPVREAPGQPADVTTLDRHMTRIVTPTSRYVHTPVTSGAGLSGHGRRRH